MKKIIAKYWPLISICFLTILFFVLYLNRKEIAENKYTKTKLEIFKGIQEKDMDQIKNAIDSLHFGEK